MNCRHRADMGQPVLTLLHPEHSQGDPSYVRPLGELSARSRRLPAGSTRGWSLFRSRGGPVAQRHSLEDC